MTSKNLEKVQKVLGLDVCNEIWSLSIDQVKARVVQASQARETAQKELDENPKYQELKENLSALTAGKKDIDKYQKAVIKYCLFALEGKGE